MSIMCTIYEISGEESALIERDDQEMKTSIKEEIFGSWESNAQSIEDAIMEVEEIMSHLRANPEIMENLHQGKTISGSSRTHSDIGKAWDGVHYLLSGRTTEELYGTTPQLLDFLKGGEFEFHWGEYGAVFHTPSRVAKILSEMENVPDELMCQRYESEQMENVYPRIWGNEEELNWLLGTVKDLKEFLNSPLIFPLLVQFFN